MTQENENYLAYIKYEGKLVEEGYLDARKSAEILIGIDEVFKYFIYQIDKDLQGKEIEIPVRIRKGSWEALIPHDIAGWVVAGGGAGLTAYLTTALNKMAEHDFKDKGFKDVLKTVIKSIKWVIKISKHLNSMVIKKFTDVEFKEVNSETIIGIKNDKGELLYVPKLYLELYKNCPEKLFSKLTKSIEVERELAIGFNKNEPKDTDDTDDIIKIGINDKSIFSKYSDDNELLFPELIHNQYVELEGHVTRGNENSNTIGFEYNEHILTCMPSQGNIADFKDRLFTNCLMKGHVERVNESGELIEKKPRIRFSELLTIDPLEQPNLFNT